jgi:hypothetical protein
MSEQIDHERRHFFGTAGAIVAAAQPSSLVQLRIAVWTGVTLATADEVIE